LLISGIAINVQQLSISSHNALRRSCAVCAPFRAARGIGRKLGIPKLDVLAAGAYLRSLKTISKPDLKQAFGYPPSEEPINRVSAMSRVRMARPDKKIHFTNR
jgi:hypothetical protein